MLFHPVFLARVVTFLCDCVRYLTLLLVTFTWTASEDVEASVSVLSNDLGKAEFESPKNSIAVLSSSNSVVDMVMGKKVEESYATSYSAAPN
jgi:hypothetical protein